MLIDAPPDDRISSGSLSSRPPSVHSGPPASSDDDSARPSDDEVYGLRLLQKIVSEAHLRNASRLVVPIPVISFLTAQDVVLEQLHNPRALPARRAPNRDLVKTCLDMGATDVMVSPMHLKCATALEIHAYRAHKEAQRDQQAMLEFRRGRKRSWVGISDCRPFAYLREAMVSSLMKKICQIEDDDDRIMESIRITVSAESRTRVAEAIGSWHFSAHDFTDDELILVASLIFRHALAMPDLEKWRIPTGEFLGTRGAPDVSQGDLFWSVAFTCLYGLITR